MGQTQSDAYDCSGGDGGSGQTLDVADSEINNSRDGAPLERSSTGGGGGGKNQDTKCSSATAAAALRAREQREELQHVRKLSNVSHRNIQLLSLKPRSEKDAMADDLRTRRRSSLINLILGAPSSGPRFCDDLCSLSSHMSECNFGIEFFPDTHHAATTSSVSSLRLESIEDTERGDSKVCGDGSGGAAPLPQVPGKRRRSSLGSLAANLGPIPSVNPSGAPLESARQKDKSLAPSGLKQGLHQAQQKQQQQQTARQQQFGGGGGLHKPSLASTLASIDLTSSFEQHDKSGAKFYRPPLCKTKQTIFESVSQESAKGGDLKARVAKGRVNQTGRVLRRTGSELSLYSTVSASSAGAHSQRSGSTSSSQKGTGGDGSSVQETKLIIMLQVCLPFILAGFGNMAAGLVLNRVAHWRAFQHVPIFFVLLPPFVGLKGNIEMTLASRLSTLSNLKLLDTGYQRRRAYVSNLVLVLSQAIGLSVFAAGISILCEFLMGGSSKPDSSSLFQVAVLVVLASALTTAIILVLLSSIMMSLAIGLANLIQVNPDNLSTLIAALYGDVSCVLVYGLVAEWMFALREQNIILWPLIIIFSTLATWPLLLFSAYKFKETHTIALASIPPMLASIILSMGSGAVLVLVIGRFKLIALYQPVVNGFGANLIAVQASRVSTWLWCSALRRISISRTNIDPLPQKKTLGSLASFTAPVTAPVPPPPPSPLKFLCKVFKTVFWSFCNSSPNAIAARLLLLMQIPAHTLYFFVLWLLSPANYVVITWQFYSIYIALCLIQVSILLTICEPLMTLLMSRNLDPDIFGISILMALADLLGTVCLTGGFFILAGLGDANAA